MLYLFGNCQTGFLSQAMAARGLRAEFRALSTPLSLLRSPGAVPADLQEMIARHNLVPYLQDRSLENQFLMLGENDPPPSLVVVNLFHENVPLFAHMRDNYVLYIDPASWDAAPPFEAWMKERFQLIKPDPLAYPVRFGGMLEQFRKRFPNVPILLLGRLSHYPAFGPFPYSYLECWEHIYDQAGPLLAEFAATLGDCFYLDLDRVFAGIWARQERRIEAHCPFLRIELEKGGAPRISIRRDLEHIGSMWPVLAEKVEEFAKTGALVYGSLETVPESWQEPYAPEGLEAGRVLDLLANGGNYPAARAVGQFFTNPALDGAGLLAEARDRLPVCHNVLHMVKAYARINPDRRIIRFLRANAKKAVLFDQNGPAFKKAYQARLKLIEEEILGANAT